MLTRPQKVDVSIESPDGKKGTYSCSSLKMARDKAEGWPTGSIIILNLTEHGVVLKMTMSKFGTLY